MAHSGWIPPDQLPQLGDWDGPIYGELGVLESDGQRVACHACGRWYTNLGNHVRHTHGLLPAEYRAIFGLRATTGLAGPVYKQRSAQLAVRNFQPYWGELSSRAMPSEQRAAYARGRRLRLESKLDPENQRAWAENGARLQRQMRELMAAGLWRMPQPRDRAGALARAQARWRELMQDPEYRRRLGQKIAEVRGRKAFTCRNCGATFTRRPDWTGWRTCSQACTRELRRQSARRLDMKSPRMRGPISQAARRRNNRAYEETVERLQALNPQAFTQLPPDERSLVQRYYGLLDAAPVSRKQLIEESGYSEWQVRESLRRGVARLLDLPPRPAVLITCPTCGREFAKSGKRRYCTPRCAVLAARRHPAQCAMCGRSFLGPTRQRYCSLACAGQVRGEDWRAGVRRRTTASARCWNGRWPGYSARNYLVDIAPLPDLAGVFGRGWEVWDAATRAALWWPLRSRTVI